MELQDSAESHVGWSKGQLFLSLGSKTTALGLGPLFLRLQKRDLGHPWPQKR